VVTADLLELDDSNLEPLPLDGMEVARVLIHEGGPPHSQVRFNGREYRYARSFPIKGHGASLPRFIREQLGAGKTPLVLERPDRFYVYLDV